MKVHPAAAALAFVIFIVVVIVILVEEEGGGNGLTGPAAVLLTQWARLPIYTTPQSALLFFQVGGRLSSVDPIGKQCWHLANSVDGFGGALAVSSPPLLSDPYYSGSAEFAGQGWVVDSSGEVWSTLGGDCRTWASVGQIALSAAVYNGTLFATEAADGSVMIFAGGSTSGVWADEAYWTLDGKVWNEMQLPEASGLRGPPKFAHQAGTGTVSFFTPSRYTSALGEFFGSWQPSAWYRGGPLPLQAVNFVGAKSYVVSAFDSDDYGSPVGFYSFSLDGGCTWDEGETAPPWLPRFFGGSGRIIPAMGSDSAIYLCGGALQPNRAQQQPECWFAVEQYVDHADDGGIPTVTTRSSPSTTSSRSKSNSLSSSHTPSVTASLTPTVTATGTHITTSPTCTGTRSPTPSHTPWCPAGYWGPSCAPCAGGGGGGACSGQGACDGSGTRGGSGACACNWGRTGAGCESAATLTATVAGSVAGAGLMLAAGFFYVRVVVTRGSRGAVSGLGVGGENAPLLGGAAEEGAAGAGVGWGIVDEGPESPSLAPTCAVCKKPTEDPVSSPGRGFACRRCEPLIDGELRWDAVVPECAVKKDRALTLGDGSFSLVFAAKLAFGDPQKARTATVDVAVKFLKLSQNGRGASDELLAGLAREVDAMRRASAGNPRHVVHFHGFLRGAVSPAWERALGPRQLPVLQRPPPDPPEVLAVVTGRCEGGTLERLLHEGVAPWAGSLTEKLHLLCDVASALAHLHGLEPAVLHGDIKSANVLLEAGAELRPRLADFGLSRVREGLKEGGSARSLLSHATRGRTAGTVAYMAPELFFFGSNPRQKKVSTATDAYAFGTLCWEVLCVRRPWEEADADERTAVLFRGGGLDITALPADTGGVVREMVAALLSFDAGARPRMHEARDVLKRAAQTLASGRFSVGLLHVPTPGGLPASLTSAILSRLSDTRYRALLVESAEDIERCACVVLLARRGGEDATARLLQLLGAVRGESGGGGGGKGGGGGGLGRPWGVCIVEADSRMAAEALACAEHAGATAEALAEALLWEPARALRAAEALLQSGGAWVDDGGGGPRISLATRKSGGFTRGSDSFFAPPAITRSALPWWEEWGLLLREVVDLGAAVGEDVSAPLTAEQERAFVKKGMPAILQLIKRLGATETTR